MAWIYFYFLAKSYLAVRGQIQLHLFWNLLLLAILALPLHRWFRHSTLVSVGRGIVGVVGGLCLFWYDSNFPPVSYLLDFLKRTPTLSPAYVVQFSRGYVSPLQISILVALLAVCLLVARRGIRLTPLVVLVLCFSTTSHFGDFTDVDKHWNDFMTKESKRRVSFPARPGSPPFDIIILNVCSLSWDDLDTAGLAHDPFWSQFDYLFTGFNSVSSYSEPSALRLLRANCGQCAHGQLWWHWPDGCSLIKSLRAAGYRTYTTMNHSGGLPDGMLDQIQEFAGADPMCCDKTGLTPQLISYDGEPLYGNFDVLQRWWAIRQRDNAPKAALFYNTITMHSGAHLVKDGYLTRSMDEQFPINFGLLSRDLTRFFQLIRDSGRRAVVVLVPEHGQALRGTSLQAQDLRDIPLPQITRVPFAFKIIDPSRPDHPASKRVSRPVSFLAVSALLATFIEHPPFGKEPKKETKSLARVVRRLPTTEPMNEIQDCRVFMYRGSLYMFGKEKKWIKLSSNAAGLDRHPESAAARDAAE